MDKPKTIRKILHENFERWETTEDIVLHDVCITTDRLISNELKLLIERSGSYYGGPAIYHYSIYKE